jgi:hypothetical protein
MIGFIEPLPHPIEKALAKSNVEILNECPVAHLFEHSCQAGCIRSVLSCAENEETEHSRECQRMSCFCTLQGDGSCVN